MTLEMGCEINRPNGPGVKETVGSIKAQLGDRINTCRAFFYTFHSTISFCKDHIHYVLSVCVVSEQAWTDVKLTSPQLSREATYKLSLKNATLQCTSSRQVFLWVWGCAINLSRFSCLVCWCTGIWLLYLRKRRIYVSFFPDSYLKRT